MPPRRNSVRRLALCSRCGDPHIARAAAQFGQI